ncbi:hypothetical protein WN943_016999 [Citrus x changshan-huyou]
MTQHLSQLQRYVASSVTLTVDTLNNYGPVGHPFIESVVREHDTHPLESLSTVHKIPFVVGSGHVGEN